VRRLVALALLAATAACGPSDGGGEEPPEAAPTTVRVLAAASLTEAFGAVADAFEEADDGVEVELSFGGSPALVTQLAAGAPADVLATADEESMQRAVEAGDVAAPVVFARNRLTVVVEPGNPRGIATVEDLARDDVLLVLCAPAVPCGRLAIRALEAAGVRATPRSQEENVKAVLSKVTLGEADAGLVYETDVRAAGATVQALPILPSDADLTTPYPIAVAREAEASRAAAEFVAFVRSDAGQRVLADHGFSSAG
jgi:molybdate transport system substrate-binding protein